MSDRKACPPQYHRCLSLPNVHPGPLTGQQGAAPGQQGPCCLPSVRPPQCCCCAGFPHSYPGPRQGQMGTPPVQRRRCRRLGARPSRCRWRAGAALRRSGRRRRVAAAVVARRPASHSLQSAGVGCLQRSPLRIWCNSMQKLHLPEAPRVREANIARSCQNLYRE